MSFKRFSNSFRFQKSDQNFQDQKSFVILSSFSLRFNIRCQVQTWRDLPHPHAFQNSVIHSVHNLRSGLWNKWRLLMPCWNERKIRLYHLLLHIAQSQSYEITNFWLCWLFALPYNLLQSPTDESRVSRLSHSDRWAGQHKANKQGI